MGYKAVKKHNIVNSNSGFSIVEVLVAVAIIAIVFTPLLRSFTTADIINSKSQKLQNVTSLAEGVMEDVKGKSIQELHDLAVNDSRVSFNPVDSDGGLTLGNLTKTPPYEVFYDNVTATQGITYDAKVTIDTEKYSVDKSSMSSTDAGYYDASDANVRELPVINKVDSHENAVISWEINQYDKKALENLAAENSDNGNVTSLKNSYKTSAEKYINIDIKDDSDSGLTKITCEVEYRTGNSGDKSLKYLVYSGYFSEANATEVGRPNVYLFYTLSENIVGDDGNKISDPIKNEHIKIEDTTTGGKRHSVYFIMQDGENKLSTLNGSKVSLDVHGSGWSDSISYDHTSTIPYSTKLLLDTDVTTSVDDVVFCSNLLDQNGNEGKLHDSAKKTRVYYVTVDIMEHSKTEVLATLTSTMQAGKEANN